MMKLKDIRIILFAGIVSCGMTFTACSDKLDEQPDSRWIHILQLSAS